MTALDVDTDQLTDLDFAPTLPCEHHQHPTHTPDQPAAWDITLRCPTCHNPSHYLLCEPGRQRMRPPATLGCRHCGHTGGWDVFVIACHPIPETRGAP